MKQIILKKVLILMILFTSCAESQNYNTLLTYNQYRNIEIDGVTLNSINETRGKHQDLNTLFNTSFQYYETSIPDDYREVSSNNLNIGFDNDSNQLDYEISHIKVLSSNIQVKILDKNISIGDLIDSLGSVEIKNNSVAYKIDSNSNQFFLSRVNFLLIVFDEDTRLITEIEFVVMT